MTMEEYKDGLKYYGELEKTFTTKHDACRKLKQQLKNIDAAIEKINNINKTTLSIDPSNLIALYATVYSDPKEGEQQWKDHLLLKPKTLNRDK